MHNDLNIGNNDIKIISRLKHKFDFDLVLEVTNKVRQQLLSKRTLYVGWKSCNLADHIFIKRCTKCNLIGHSFSICTQDHFSCHKCNENHKARDCKANASTCINCVNFNAKHKNKKVSTDHSSQDLENCHCYNWELQNKKSKIDYGQT